MAKNRLDRRLDFAVFIILIASLFFAYIYPKVLPLHPKTVHQWRQCDGASIAMMYVHNGLNPFTPEVHNQHGAGKTVAEFPLIYYIDACIISIVGTTHKDFVIRAMNLLILYLGLFYLFKIGLFIFKNRWLALLPVVFLHSSPIIAYYASTSVPDSSALAFAIIGVYFLIKFIDKNLFNSLLLAILATALAGMIKSTILVLYLSFLCMLAAAFIRGYKPLKLPLKSYFLLMIPILVTALWIIAAKTYNAHHENITFLLDVKPIWELDKTFINKTTVRIKQIYMETYSYVPLIWFVLSVGLIFLIIPNRRFNYIKFGIAMLILGTVVYFFLFFEQFYEHDYYGIELLPMILALFMTTLYWLSDTNYLKLISKGFVGLTILLLLLNIYTTRKIMIKRYTEDAIWNAYYDEYLEFGPKLRAKGIPYSDKFILASDISPNIGLYLLDQLGWTKFPYGINEELVESYIDEGAKYLIISETDFPIDSFLLPHTNNLIFTHKQLKVFDLKASKK